MQIYQAWHDRFAFDVYDVRVLFFIGLSETSRTKPSSIEDFEAF